MNLIPTLLAIVFSFFLISCDKIMSRPKLDKREYIKKVLPEVEFKNIEAINYEYNSSIGGFVSIAKLKMKTSDDLIFLDKIPQSRIINFYGEEGEINIKYIKLLFSIKTNDSSGNLPKWFDMKFSQPVVELKSVKKKLTRTFFVLPNSLEFYMIAGGD